MKSVNTCSRCALTSAAVASPQSEHLDVRIQTIPPEVVSDSIWVPFCINPLAQGMLGLAEAKHRRSPSPADPPISESAGGDAAQHVVTLRELIAPSTIPPKPAALAKTRSSLGIEGDLRSPRRR